MGVLLAIRKVPGPPVDSFVWPARGLPPCAWLQLNCERLNTGGLENDASPPQPIRSVPMGWERVVLFLRIAAAAWAGVVLVIAALQHYDVVPTTPKLEPWVWVISLAIIAVDNVGTLFARRVRSRRDERARKLEAALMTLLIQIVKPRDLRFEDLGAHVYIPSRADLLFRRTDVRRFQRVKRFRPAGFPQQSGIDWSPSKGTVGDCWRTKRTAYKDWEAIARTYGGRDLTEAEYDALPAETRHGFSRAEFHAIAGKYSEIIAEPIWSGRNERALVGVLAVDRAYQDNESTFEARLDTRATREIASTAASVVGSILKPKTGDG